MKTAIVGYTGFVGSNLCASTKFDFYYNSKNIEQAYGTEPDILVYSGVPSQMFIANKNPEQDLSIIQEAIQNIKKIAPHKIILISTIAVYDRTFDVNEDSLIDKENASPYGRNRRFLEEWVENNCLDYLIVRLPGLYGINLKKNFIYDMINIIPPMLSKETFSSLSSVSSVIKKSYYLETSGFAKCVDLNAYERELLKHEFLSLDFSSLNFTDSRGVFQYFNLRFLWSIIQKALIEGISLLNVAVEPITISELYSYIYDGKLFFNEINSYYPHYDFKTKYATVFGGNDGYIFDKTTVINDIRNFILKERHYS